MKSFFASSIYMHNFNWGSESLWQLQLWWKQSQSEWTRWKRLQGLIDLEVDVINKRLLSFSFSLFYFLRGNVTFSPGGPAWPSGPLWPVPGSPYKHIFTMFHCDSFKLDSQLPDCTVTNWKNYVNGSLWINIVFTFCPFSPISPWKKKKMEIVKLRKQKCTSAHCFSWAKINQHGGIWNKK